MTTPITPSDSDRTTPRRWGLPLAFIGGAAAVALAGAAAFAGQAAASAAPLQTRGEHVGSFEHGHEHGHGHGREMRMQAHADVDPAVRGERIAELAQRLGVDADELSATLEAFHAERAVDHEAMREMLAGLEPTERRDAMRAFADERRALMAEVLGVDREVLAELHAETGHGPRGPQGGRMGPQSRG